MEMIWASEKLWHKTKCDDKLTGLRMHNTFLYFCNNQHLEHRE